MTATHPDPPSVDGSAPDTGDAVGDGTAADPGFDPRMASPLTRLLARVPVWVPPVVVGGLALGSCVYVGLVDPNTTSSAFYPQCAFKQMTGLDCPGCGLTRAMHSVVTGHPLQALDHNILIALILPLATYTYAVWLVRAVFGYQLPYISVPKKLGYALAPLVIGFWILRNVPWGPFTYLASGAS
jgi:hypothetical protein